MLDEKPEIKNIAFFKFNCFNEKDNCIQNILFTPPSLIKPGGYKNVWRVWVRSEYSSILKTGSDTVRSDIEAAGQCVCPTF